MEPSLLRRSEGEQEVVPTRATAPPRLQAFSTCSLCDLFLTADYHCDNHAGPATNSRGPVRAGGPEQKLFSAATGELRNKIYGYVFGSQEVRHVQPLPDKVYRKQAPTGLNNKSAVSTGMIISSKEKIRSSHKH